MLNISKSETISYPSVHIYILCCISHAFDQNMYQLFAPSRQKRIPEAIKCYEILLLETFMVHSKDNRNHIYLFIFYNTGYLSSLLVTVDVLISSSTHLFSTALPHSLSD